MKVTFKGRTAGAIGIFYPITIEVPSHFWYGHEPIFERRTIPLWIEEAHRQGFEVNHLIKVEKGKA